MFRRFLPILVVVILFAFTVPAAAHPITVDGYPITIEFEPAHEKVAKKIAEICGDRIPRLAAELGLNTVEPFCIYLIDDIAAFEKEQGIRLPTWGVAFAFMDNQIMLVDVARATRTWNGLDQVIPHELSHLLVAQRVGGVLMPLWFVEGLALWQAREWSMVENWRLMEAVWANRAPSLAHIHGSMPVGEASARDAYRVAYSAITDRFDDNIEALPAFFDELVRTGDFATAFESFFGEDEASYTVRFAASLDKRYKSRLMLFQMGPLFSVIAVLFLFVYFRVYLRSRRKMRDLGDGDIAG